MLPSRPETSQAAERGDASWSRSTAARPRIAPGVCEHALVPSHAIAPETRSTWVSSLVLRWVDRAVPLGIMIGAAAIAWVRLLPVDRNTAWAEDATFFLSGQLQHGTVGSLFLPYQGYLHLVPRLLVDVAVHVAPIEDYALTMTKLTVLVVGAVGAGVYVLSAPYVPSRLARIALAVVPVIAPLSPVEILGNAANLHTFLLYLAPWVFLARPRNWWTAAGLGVVAGLVCCTEIQTLFFVPLLVLRVRQRRSWPIAAASVSGLVCQIVTTIAYPRTASTQPPIGLRDVLWGFVLEPFAQSFTSDWQRLGRAVVREGGWIVLVPFIAACVGIGFAMRYGPHGSRLIMGVMMWGSVVTWTAALTLNRAPQFRYAEFTGAQMSALSTSRYAAAGSLFVLGALVVAADVALAARRRRLRGIGFVAMALLVVVAVIGWTPESRTRDLGPLWSPQVQAERHLCGSAAAPTGVVIQAAPFPRWSVTVPCAMIAQAQ